MGNVSIITGGAGGMGLSTAKILGNDRLVLLCDLDKLRLDRAASELKELGIACDTVTCDITSRAQVDAVVAQAQQLGNLASVVHTAGISPQMGAAEKIIRVNALGTVNIVDACYPAAREGFVLVNVASMAAYFMPWIILPKRGYRYAFSDSEIMVRKLTARSKLLPTDFYRRGMAYGISKNFVMWYSRQNASRFGLKGARILSVSPGTYDTEMGKLEEKSGSMNIALKTAALKRPGRTEEIAELLAFCATDKAGYLTGVDILADGGCVTGTHPGR